MDHFNSITTILFQKQPRCNAFCTRSSYWAVFVSLPDPGRESNWEKDRQVENYPLKTLVAHALLGAVFALLRTQASGIDHSVHTSVNAARTSACATTFS
jgi:hypothetical protein